MPTYEFRCPQGHEFEKLYRTISGAEAQSACPTCGQLGERIMSATGFAFKGSGFYLTDYGKNAHREKGTSAPAASGGEGGKAESAGGDTGSKTDSTPAASAPAAAGEGAKSAPKPAAEPKPAPAPAKKSAAE